MRGIRKFIGVFIIAFIGIPVLIGMIWAVGVTKAVVSPEFLSELPRDVIEKIPALIDETLEAVDEEGVIDDPQSRIWVRAITSVSTSPKELLEKIGIMSWLQNELSQSLEEIGKVLRGETRPKPVMLNLRPLKQALLSPEINSYLLELLKKLPECNEEQLEEWTRAIARGDDIEDCPPCRPIEPEKAIEIFRLNYEREVGDIPDEINIMNIDRNWYFRDNGLDIARWVVSMTFILFLIPALFIGLGSLIGASSGMGILRWMGWSTLIGGGLTFAMSRFAGRALQWGIGFGPFPFADWNPDVNLPMLEIALEKTGDIALVVMDHLLGTVDSVSGTVAIVGIIMIAVSYLGASNRGPATRPTTGQQPSQPSQPAQPSQPQQGQPASSQTTETDSVEVQDAEYVASGEREKLSSSDLPPAVNGNGATPLSPPPKDD